MKMNINMIIGELLKHRRTTKHIRTGINISRSNSNKKPDKKEC
jgi:hypothetical protein